MSGPVRTTLHALLPALLILIGGRGLCRAAETASALVAPPDTVSSAPPYTLRLEWTMDRETLEAAGIRRPSRLAYDSDGNLHVLDAETRRVVKLDPRGRVLYAVGGYGSDETSLELPVDIAVDRDQSLLVLDRGRGAIVAFDRAGRFLGQRLFQGAAAEEARDAGARILLDRFGKLWLLSPRARDLVPLDDRLGPERATRFLVPEDSLVTPVVVAGSPGGEFWIYDAAGGAVRRFGASGRLTQTIYTRRTEVSISDLAVDLAGFLYMANRTGQCIQAFGEKIDGALITDRVFGGDKIPWRPGALAIGPRRQIAVAEPERDEIQVLMPESKPLIRRKD